MKDADESIELQRQPQFSNDCLVQLLIEPWGPLCLRSFASSATQPHCYMVLYSDFYELDDEASWLVVVYGLPPHQ